MSGAAAGTIRRAHAVQPVTAVQNEYSPRWRRAAGTGPASLEDAAHVIRDQLVASGTTVNRRNSRPGCRQPDIECATTGSVTCCRCDRWR